MPAVAATAPAPMADNEAAAPVMPVPVTTWLAKREVKALRAVKPPNPAMPVEASACIMAPLPVIPAPRRAVTMLRLLAKDKALTLIPPPVREAISWRVEDDGLFADKADGHSQVRYRAHQFEYLRSDKAGEQ